jgi:hypothetical protein
LKEIIRHKKTSIIVFVNLALQGVWKTCLLIIFGLDCKIICSMVINRIDDTIEYSSKLYQLFSCFTTSSKDVPEQGEGKRKEGQETPKDAHIIEITPIKQTQTWADVKKRTVSATESISPRTYHP